MNIKPLKLLAPIVMCTGLVAGVQAHPECDAVQAVMADAEINLRFEVPADHCLVRLYGTFDDTRSGHSADFELEGLPHNDGEWMTARGQMPVPLSSLLTLSVSLLAEDGEGHCEFPADEGRVWIRYLRLTFDRPGAGDRITRTVIGGAEGHDALAAGAQENATAWLTRSTTAIAYSKDERSVRFETVSRSNALFFKPVDLVHLTH